MSRDCEYERDSIVCIMECMQAFLSPYDVSCHISTLQLQFVPFSSLASCVRIKHKLGKVVRYYICNGLCFLSCLYLIMFGWLGVGSGWVVVHSLWDSLCLCDVAEWLGSANTRIRARSRNGFCPCLRDVNGFVPLVRDVIEAGSRLLRCSNSLPLTISLPFFISCLSIMIRAMASSYLS